MRMALWQVRLPSAWRGVTGTQTTLGLPNDLYEKSLTQLGKKHTKQPRSLGYSKDSADILKRANLRFFLSRK